MEWYNKVKMFVWSKHFLKHFGLVVLTYLVIVFVTVFYLDALTNHGERIEVPSFLGKNINSVRAQIEDLGLQYEIQETEYDPEKPEGTILEQNPEPTALSMVGVKEGRIIRFTVSKRTNLVEMPSLVDKSERFAKSILENRGLKYRIEYKPTNEADNAVLDQRYNGRSVREGENVPVGATILLIVGKNDSGVPVEIPNLFGLTFAEAQELLARSGEFQFITICPDCITSEDSLAARIESQTPEYLEGITIPSKSIITVYATKDFKAQQEQPE
jgi:beta-lactam-binding protein with PASTA domain